MSWLIVITRMIIEIIFMSVLIVKIVTDLIIDSIRTEKEKKKI